MHDTLHHKTNYHKNAEENSARITNNAIKGYRNAPFCVLPYYCFDGNILTLRPIKVDDINLLV